MSQPIEILVVITSVVLVIFLILAIVLAIMLIRISKNIGSITDSVKHTTGQIETVVENVSKATTPMLITKMIMKQFKDIKENKK